MTLVSNRYMLQYIITSKILVAEKHSMLLNQYRCFFVDYFITNFINTFFKFFFIESNSSVVSKVFSEGQENIEVNVESGKGLVFF